MKPMKMVGPAVIAIAIFSLTAMAVEDAALQPSQPHGPSSSASQGATEQGEKMVRLSDLMRAIESGLATNLCGTAAYLACTKQSSQECSTQLATIAKEGRCAQEVASKYPPPAVKSSQQQDVAQLYSRCAIAQHAKMRSDDAQRLGKCMSDKLSGR